jgi:serine/threonine-protein kinase
VRVQYALALHHLERTAEAIAVSRKVTIDDPLLWLGWLSHGAFLRNFGRMPEARAALQRAIELNPESSWTRHVLGGLELLEGKADSALAIFRQAGSAYRLHGLAMAEHSLGHARESAQALAELEAGFATGFSLQIAEAHAWRGDFDAAFEWLDRACEQRDSGIPRVRGNPFLRALRGDPRYAALLERLAFPKLDAAAS